MGEPTAALLSQTRPTLIDLIVAALAGFAGLLALIDQRISPALPGVAIATALNPPDRGNRAVPRLGGVRTVHGARSSFSLPMFSPFSP